MRLKCGITSNSFPLCKLIITSSKLIFLVVFNMSFFSSFHSKGFMAYPLDMYIQCMVNTLIYDYSIRIVKIQIRV